MRDRDWNRLKSIAKWAAAAIVGYWAFGYYGVALVAIIWIVKG